MNPGCTHPQGIIKGYYGNAETQELLHGIMVSQDLIIYVKGKSTLALITGLDTFPLIFLMIGVND